MSNNEEKVWGPTETGSAFTGSREWSFALRGAEFTLIAERQEWTGCVLKLKELKVSRGFIWSSIEFPLTWPWTLDRRVQVDGIPNLDAMLLQSAVRRAMEQEARRVTAVAKRFASARPSLVAWAEAMTAACEEEIRRNGWVTKNFRPARPKRPKRLEELLTDPTVVSQLAQEYPDASYALSLWAGDYREVNAKHLADEKTASAQFFAQVESRPLSDEQMEAVICLENRVLVVAAAGSGKTSTIVAKAGYAVHKGYVAPEKVLLLAFNNDAASELRQRLKARLQPLGVDADKLTAKTFHSFGLDVIGAATGKRPSLAPWLDSGKDLETLLSIVHELKAADRRFSRSWDLLRVVFDQDLPAFGKEHEFPDSWDPANRRRGFRTLKDDVVKSRGEQTIADWLFYNGVPYVYEKEYKHDTADAKHRQYRPDFFLPSVGAYLEHWALDDEGNPPADFEGYKESMLWKRALHAQRGTVLLETTSAQLRTGEAFTYLKTELGRLGAVLDPNPDRPSPGRKPVEAPRLARTFRTFQTHAKSNRLSVTALRERLNAQTADRFSYRHRLFLDLYESLAHVWEERLRSQGYIDFEDMLKLAADHIEAGTWASSFELVMVDEFQDTSQARARVLAALTRQRNARLFAVGDDWQSINRFAGADLSVMTGFDNIFGESVTLKLEQTFRCPPRLCDISSEFVQKNPRQLRKSVRSEKPDEAQPVRILRVTDVKSEGAAAVGAALDDISRQSRGRKTVFFLGRYNDDRRYLSASYDTGKLDVRFVTVHGAKGLEADHIIVPGMTSDTLGFPSGVADDPVLQLAMPEGESYPHAEERRLFYVALTRAKESVTLITQVGKESPFISELIAQHDVKTYELNGKAAAVESCPDCREGLLAVRNGKFGEFLGCSRFPRCRYTRNLPKGSTKAGGSPIGEIEQPAGGKRQWARSRKSPPV